MTAIFGRYYRFKKNEQIIAGLRPVLNRSVCFGDDNFCAHPSRTKSLVRDMIAENAALLRVAGQMRVGAASNDELLTLMQETRCRTMYVGIESLEAETLRKFGKPHEIETNARCIENLRSRNIGIHAMFVVGFGDSTETVHKIVDYAIPSDIDPVQICPLIPLPITAVYRDLHDRLLHREWKYFDGTHVVVEWQKCSAYELQMAILRE